MKLIGIRFKKLVLMICICTILTVINANIYAVSEEQKEKEFIIESGNNIDGETNNSNSVKKDTEANTVTQIGEKNQTEVAVAKADKPKTDNKGDSSDVMKLATFVIAAAAVAGGSAYLNKNSGLKRKNHALTSNEDNTMASLTSDVSTKGKAQDKEVIAKKYIKQLQGVLPQRNGLWIAPDERSQLIFEINSVSAKKYTIDIDGYLIEDIKQNIDTKKSQTASDVIDNLIKANNKVIVGVDNGIHKFDAKTGKVKKQDIVDGISMGDKKTGFLVLISNVNNSSLTLLHELAHATDGMGSAINVENKIRTELNLKTRKVNRAEKEEMFFNNYGEGEGYLEDFAKTLGVTVQMDKDTQIGLVQSKDIKANFENGVDGTYFEPDTNKMVVKEKQFRYKMNLDLGKDEVYLRSYVESNNGKIEWIESEKQAIITINGKEINIKVGDPGVKIINDRIVMTLDDTVSLLEANSDFAQKEEIESDGYSYNDYYEQDYASTEADTNTGKDTVSNREQADDYSYEDSSEYNADDDYSSKDGAESSDDGYSYNEDYNNDLQAVKDDDVSELSMLMAGNKHIKKIVQNKPLTKNENDFDSYRGFILGVKEVLTERGFEPSKVALIQQETKKVNKAAMYLSRAVVKKGSEERKTLFTIVSNDLSQISNSKNKDIAFKEARKYGKAIASNVLDQTYLSGFVGTFSTIISIIGKDLPYKKKINIMQKHTQNQLEIYNTLKEADKDLNELICKAREEGEFFVIEMWEWEINVIIKKSLISGREAVFLVKLCTVA